MRVAVTGTSIVGTATAFELASASLQVQVFERQTSVASVASYAATGLLAPLTPEALALGGWAWRFKRLRGLRRLSTANRDATLHALISLGNT